MHGGLQAISVWTQVPVASRTVEVNTKTGFSLTAGSYVVTGTVARGTMTIANLGSSITATISAVTLAKTDIHQTGLGDGASGSDTVNIAFRARFATLELTNTTTLTATRTGTDNTLNIIYQVVPFV